MLAKKLSVVLLLGLLLTSVANTQDSSDVAQNRIKCLEHDSFGLCMKCNYEYFLQDNLCYLCSNACRNCLSPTVCGECRTSYRLSAEGKCEWILFDIMLLFNLFFFGLIIVVGVIGWVFGSKETLLMSLAGDSIGMAKKEDSVKSPQQTSLDEDKMGYSSIKDL